MFIRAVTGSSRLGVLGSTEANDTITMYRPAARGTAHAHQPQLLGRRAWRGT